MKTRELARRKVRVLTGLGRESNFELEFSYTTSGWILEITNFKDELQQLSLNEKQMLLLEKQIRMIREEFVND